MQTGMHIVRQLQLPAEDGISKCELGYHLSCLPVLEVQERVGTAQGFDFWPPLADSSRILFHTSFALPSSTQHSKKSGPASTVRIGRALMPPRSSPGMGLACDGGWRLGSEGIQGWGCY